ncbi:MAG: macrolide ABC transporter ATP-binding protein [Bdellovibrio sp. CG12_big_fil_rev_8_21_14_0_65_39_13]|nr:MAG: macrolide ABC transporter ATP-binding protein [Bdellovibrio sp. CG22_combo_CG10-13_8_21_14_all_39_27]PIQ58530.1 MAG: macrolide ABC transporter ATP-binding protein [Bdellovibrio sp. CG12_big_fil_rev_8_21_14_0_65_39_13]PIR34161.1 MAG: macrolide ABC transporter ATP-binding protein [Bdellovibrio sp. CG11_big_fil_rev_8_21_14_0_20_39_38]
MEHVFQLENVSKVFGEGAVQVKALNSINLEFHRGEFSALIGPSGSGKSTLLNIMSGLDTPTTGDVFLDGINISEMSGNKLCDFRRDHIGFIFQSFNLIPVLTVKENIEYIMLLQGVAEEKRLQRVEEILERIGLKGFNNRYPNQLSGGQQQRVAIARAIASQPSIILADEPTANLDSKTGTELIDLMAQLNADYGTTFIFSTHDQKIMDRARRLVTLEDGKIVSDKLS